MGKSFPKTGTNWDELKDRLTEARQGDIDWRTGKISGLLYYAGDDVVQVAHDAYAMYFNENAVYPKVYPSLANMEEEVIGPEPGAASRRRERCRKHDDGRHRKHLSGHKVRPGLGPSQSSHPGRS